MAAIACLAIVLASGQGLRPKQLEYKDKSLTLGTLARYEYDSGVMGTAYGNEWLPSTAKPGFTSPLYQPVAPAEPDPSAAATVLDFRRTGPLSFEARVIAGKTSRLRFHSFYFPGWQAKVDGRAVATYPSTDLGIVTFDLPEGQHDVALSFEDTAARAVGRALSLIALVALSIVALRTTGRIAPFSPEARPAGPSTGRHVAPNPVRYANAGKALALHALASLPLLLAGLAVLQPFLMRPSAPAASAATVDFGGLLRLLAYETDVQSTAENGTVGVTLYWQTLEAARPDLKIALEAIDERGNLLARQLGAPVYSTASTSAWSVNEIVRDRRELRLSRGTSPKPISLRLGVLAGEELLGSTDLGTLSASFSEGLPATAPRPKIDRRVDGNFAGQLLLLGYSGPARMSLPSPRALGVLAGFIQPAGVLRVTLFWQALATPDRDYVVSLRLLDGSGKLVVYHDSQPQMGFLPTSLWQPGEVIEDVHLPGLPPTLQPGIYSLEANIYQPHAGENLWPKESVSPNLRLGQIELLP